MSNEDLQKAIGRREHAYFQAIDRLRDLATDETEDEVHTLTSTLKEALYLLASSRRLIDGRSASEIHKAFGAPGNWGYETPIGDALYRLYMPPEQSAGHEVSATKGGG